MHIPLKPRGPWANGPLPVIGLIGGIGSGKSLVASTLGTAGLQVLDADAIGHALLAQRPAIEQVVERFGPGILSAGTDGEERQVDRQALARIVFHDLGAKQDLEAILHPSMRKTFERAIRRASRTPAVGIVLDAAILYEAGWNNLCDAVVFIDAPREARLERLAAQRGWTEDDLAARERSQAPLDAKKDRADTVLSNDSTPESLQQAALAWWKGFSPVKRAKPRGR